MNFDSASSVLQPFVARHELAGAVTLVADSDAVLSLQAVGFSDVAAQTPLATDALFWIASQTKSITATALMMLVEADLVALDDPVAKYLPAFADLWLLAPSDDANRRLLVRPSHPITIREILSHTAGFPFLTPVEEPFLGGLSLRGLSQLYPLLPLQSEPGAHYCYSNIGFNIAGRIIEVVSGQTYPEFLQTRLFDPLEMTDTTFWPDSEQLKRLAATHRLDAQGDGLETIEIPVFRTPLDDACRHPEAGGGLFSTARDVGRFCQMILRGGQWNGQRYLSPASVRQMATRQTPAEMESYGLGWATGGDWFGHDGACSTNMMIHPAKGLVTVWLVQHQGFPGAGAQSRGQWQARALEALGQTK